MSIKFKVGDRITDICDDVGTIRSVEGNEYTVVWDSFGPDVEPDEYCDYSVLRGVELEHRLIESPSLTVARLWKQYAEDDDKVSPHEIEGFSEAMEKLCESIGVTIDYGA